MMTVLQALERNTSHRRAVYFLWRNKIKSQRADHTNMTDQEFINKHCHGDPLVLQGLRAWEKTEQYADFINLMLYDRSGVDFLDIYNKVTEKAKKGDDRAVKTFLLLQKLIKTKVKDTKKKQAGPEAESDEDEDLVLE